MTKNRLRTALVFVLALLFLIPLSLQAAESIVSTSASYIETEKNNPVISTDQEVAVNVGLLDRYGNAPATEPPGIVYIWSETRDREGQVSDALELADGAGVAADAGPDGVVAVEAKALMQELQVRVRFLRPDQYIVKAAYFADGAPFVPTSVRAYEPFMLAGASGTNAVEVGSDSSAVRTVRIEVLGPKPVAPFEVPVVDGEATIDREIFVRGDGVTTTKVRATFLNSHGTAAGSGKKVFFSASSVNLELSPQVAEINRRGEVEVGLTGRFPGQYKLHIGFNKPPTVPNPEPLPTVVPPARVSLRIGSDALDIDGHIVHSGAAALVRNGRTFVPLRAVAEGLAARVHYDVETRMIEVVRNNRAVLLRAGMQVYTINDSEGLSMDAAPYLEGDVTMVPLRFVAEALQTEVTPVYDASGLTIGVNLRSKVH